MNLSKLLEENRQAILDLTIKHGAKNVRIFGSVFRRIRKTDF